MLRESVVLIRVKMFLDLLMIGTIILGVENYFVYPPRLSFLSTFSLALLGNLVTWLLCARSFGLYNDLRLKPFSVEWIMFLKAFGLYALITSFVAFQVFKSYPYNQHQYLLQCVLLFLLLPVQKVLLRVLFKKFRNSPNVKRKVLIVGAGQTGLNFYRDYVQNLHYGYQLAGFVDDQKHPSLNGHYLGKTSELKHVISRHDLDDIVVTLPITRESEINEIVTLAEREGKRVRIIPNFEHFGSGRMQVDRMGNLSMITLRPLPLDSLDNKIYKRIFDIVFSLLVVVCVFSWLFPIIALLIKLTSKGPVFFKQERWGLNNKTIVCWKFRTMKACSCKDVDEAGKYKQASKNDPRITRIGGFLRKTSLDEMPQFINVLFGSMSVIGPRPHPVPLNLESKDAVEKYMMRLWMKPGISGWAQVNGYRGETKDLFLMKKRVRYDLWYIENWTFWLDLQIIVQTLVNAVKGEENAY
ncbi:undecaprenyl-phosphate glucose phosphotransferase [Flavisolibacter ginsenosidimutans]|uniref:Undecaprenyl-phosphate glucose phosphotransferase n=2 Tax=Flavisolibacter ginsenosidimutans TaxID=661481 RepID=A0A5B8ULW3_9BACT|nr:undecaprenyl-phosphate glucose phosphotransferase [Flavisolibacter ginsenosidimutans]